MRPLALVLVAWMLSSCAAGLASPNRDTEAKRFRALPDKACIYVVPPNGSTAVTVAMDGRNVARLEETSFLRLDVPPGRHVLTVAAASLLPFFLRQTPDALTVEAEAGHCYYLRALWEKAERGWRPFRVYWAKVPEAEGQREINIRRLILPAM